MDESSIETQEIPTQVTESKADKFRKWLKGKFAKGTKPVPNQKPQRTLKENPLPIAGGAIDNEIPTQETKEWQTDTTRRLERLKPIGNNRMTTADRAIAAGVIGGPTRSDIDTRIGESLEELNKRAAEKQKEIKKSKQTGKSGLKKAA